MYVLYILPAIHHSSSLLKFYLTCSSDKIQVLSTSILNWLFVFGAIFTLIPCLEGKAGKKLIGNVWSVPEKKLYQDTVICYKTPKIFISLNHNSLMCLLFSFICVNFRPEEMIVSKRKEMFHRILWMKKMTTYRFVNPLLLNAIPGLLQFRKKLKRETGVLISLLLGGHQGMTTRQKKCKLHVGEVVFGSCPAKFYFEILDF